MKYIPPSTESWVEGRGYKKQVLLTESDLLCPGTLVQLVVIEPHSEVPFHYHEKMTEVFHIIEGTGSMTVAGQTFNLGPGDTLTTEPQELHNAINSSDSPLRYVVFKTNATEGDSVWPSEQG
jgi:quercetin dioxygenase-like cupin family protein